MLIEVLVSVLLFSVGVLALVGLQANMNQTQGAAKVRTDASYLATELTGVMWADKTHLSSYQTASCDGYARCKAWKAKLAQALPNGSATVTVNSGDITILITWSLPDGGSHQHRSETSIS
jgi:type IV pilus assembly protein PilV